MEKLDLSQLGNFWNFAILNIDNKAVTLGSVIIGIGFLILGLVFSKIISRRVSNFIGKKFKMQRNSNHVLESLVFYILIFISTLFALKLANIPITVFTVLGGAVAIGVGFGSQNLINNFISGIIMMVENPIKVGDFIEIDGIFGEVDNIGMRSTSIIAAGNRHIIVPNSFFLEKNLINWTHKNKLIKILIKVGVAYGSPTRKVAELLKKAAAMEDQVLSSPKPIVYFVDFADNSLNFELEFSIIIKSLESRKTLESNIRFNIDDLFKENEIVISFPQLDVHLNQAGALNIKMHQSLDEV